MIVLNIGTFIAVIVGALVIGFICGVVRMRRKAHAATH